MSNFYGKSGPRFVLRKDNGTVQSTYDLPTPHSMTERPWRNEQNIQRDINRILRMDGLKYGYSAQLAWMPIDLIDNTYITMLTNIVNWRKNDSRSIIYYPHRDVLAINFEVMVAEASPEMFTLVPYDAYGITVVSVNLFDGIPNPDALAAIDMSGAISINADTSIEI